MDQMFKTFIIEKRQENNPYKLKYDNEYYDAKVDKYSIKVKGKDAVDFEVVNTKHGPIIDKLLKPLGNKDTSFQCSGQHLNRHKN